MGITWFLVLIAAILVIIFITFLLEHIRTQKSWTGILKDKQIKDNYYKGHHRFIYLLHIQKDNGEKLTLNVNRDIYKSFEIGDKIKKDSGFYYPTKSI